jgi:hypothetical protein
MDGLPLMELNEGVAFAVGATNAFATAVQTYIGEAQYFRQGLHERTPVGGLGKTELLRVREREFELHLTQLRQIEQIANINIFHNFLINIIENSFNILKVIMKLCSQNKIRIFFS